MSGHALKSSHSPLSLVVLEQSPETADPSGLSASGDPYEAALQMLLTDSRSRQTRRAYAADIRDFFRATGMIGAGEEAGRVAVRQLCTQTAGALALTLNDYKADLFARGLAESTVNRRLAAVRSLLRMARRLGADVPDPRGLVSGERVTPLRDTRGPVADDVLRLLAAPDRGTIRGMRDYALLVLMIENALRRSEVCSLDVGDLDTKGKRLSIKGKGKGMEKAWVTLSDKATAAIVAYLAVRENKAEKTKADNTEGQPLFLNVDRRSVGAPQRLSVDGLYHVLQDYGQRVLGHSLSPHKMRHAAITAALDQTGGDVRKAQKLSRHADLRTLTIYDDNRTDLQGEVTRLLSEFFDERKLNERDE